MSLVSNRNSKLKKIKANINNNGFYNVSYNNKNKLNFNTVSTIEKERSTKDKSVTFKGIEIIEVESYKKYNQITILSFESIESICNKSYEECKCDVF